MIAIDTNILLAALASRHASHDGARRFVDSLHDRDDIVVSEWVLVELYGLLRNPKVMQRPLAAQAAVDVCQRLRQHPRWRLFGFPPDSEQLHALLWKKAAQPAFARRRIYDIRLGLSLVQQGVSELATANTRDFTGLGFARVWNPLTTE